MTGGLSQCSCECECESVCVCVCVCVLSVSGGGVGVRVQWIRGVREGRGGKGREGVQLPDSLVDEAVFQSVCPGLETPQSPP